MTRILTAFAVVGMLMTGLAYADATNVRPVVFGPGTVGEDSLQQVLDDFIVSGAPIDAANDQSPYALFTSGGSGGSVATFIVEITAGAANQTFGIYSSDDPTNMAQIFSGADTNGIPPALNPPTSQAIVSFLASGDIFVNYTLVATGFSSTFGFYLGTGGTYYYSEDSLNPAGDAQALIYQGSGQTAQIDPYTPGPFSPSEFVVAFEDGTDGDFQDLVVMVESIAPVPAPGAALLGVVGLSLVGWVRRRMR